MKKLFYFALVVVLMSLVLVPSAVSAADTTVTVTVLDSQNNPLAGVGVLFSTSSGFVTYTSANTDASGVATKDLPSGTYWFKAIYQNTSAVQTQDIGLDPDLTFYTSESQVQVYKSGGSAFEGVRVLFSNSNGFGNYISVNTDASGLAKTELFPGTIWYKAITNGTSAVQSAVLAGDGKTAGQSGLVTFYTSKSIAKVQNCDGVALAGIAIKFYGGGYPATWASATTDANGLASIEEFPGTWKIQASVNRTSEVKDQLLAGDGLTAGQSTTTIFTPTKVSFIGVSPVRQWAGYWDSPLTSPFYMFPATVKFQFGGSGGTEMDVAISGCTLTGGILKLVDEAGNPLANYPADYPSETRNLKWKYRCGGSWGPETSFKTDANGQFFFNIGCSNWDKKITVTLNQTTKEQNVTVNSIFQAAKVNVNLKSCTGPITDVPGGSVDQGGGFWYHHGNTGATGTVTFYTFPANIKVRMGYNHNSQTLFPTIAAGTNEVDFQTTQLTLNYPGNIKSNMGGSWWMFSKPTMYLLPGDYSFWFQNGSGWYGPVVLNVTGCSRGNTPDSEYVLLKLLDENRSGVPGGKATPAYGGSWGTTLPGVTDSNGILFAEIPLGYTKIKMIVNQGGQEQTLAQLTASNYTWKTEVLRIWLNDHSGSPITDGAAILDQGGGYWYNWGNLNTSGYRDIQLFPGSYKFKMTYNYTSQELFPAVSTGPGIQSFYFQTGQVVGPCITQYSTGAWRTFTDGMELMPGTYTFWYPSQSGTVNAGGVTTLTCP